MRAGSAGFHPALAVSGWPTLVSLRVLRDLVKPRIGQNLRGLGALVGVVGQHLLDQINRARVYIFKRQQVVVHFSLQNLGLDSLDIQH